MKNEILITADWHIENISDSWMVETKDGMLPSKVAETFKQIDYMINYAIKNKVSKFIIAGDLTHNNRPIPKYIRMLIARLNKLEKAGITTWILKGNHEENNLNEDALAPIKEINYNYITVYDDFAVSIDGRYIIIPHMSRNRFGVNATENHVSMEIKREVSDALKTTRKNKKKAIIFGHLHAAGAVTGAEQFLMKGGINFIDVKKENVQIEKIFLGHIHKYQMLKSKKISYCGSIVRTDFGEEKEDKGFIIYNEKTKKEKFIKLDTVEYKTININLFDKDHIDLNLSKIKKVAENKVLRLRIKILDQYMNNLNLFEIKEKFSKYGFISKIEKTVVNSKNEVRSYEGDYTNKELLNDYIKELKLKKGLSQLVKRKALSIINNNEQEKNQMLSSSGNVRFNRLKLKNFRSFKDADIDLSKIDVAGIVGTYDIDKSKSNGSGKTTIIISLLYALFGYYEGISDEDFVRWDNNDNEMFVKLGFKSGKNKVIIVRRRENKKNTLDLIVNKKNISGKLKETQKMINDILGMDYELFTTIVCFLDSGADTFCSATQAVRKEYLRNLLNLKLWDDCLTDINAECKELKINVNTLSDIIEESKSDLDDINLDGIKNKLNDIENDILIKNKKLEKLNDIKSKVESKNNIRKLYKSIKERKEEKEVDISYYKTHIEKYKKQISEIKVLSTNEINNNKRSLKCLEKDSNTNVTLITELKTKAGILRERIVSLEKSNKSKCVTCGNKLIESEKNKLIKNDSDKIIKFKKAYKEIIKNQEDITDKILEIKNKLSTTDKNKLAFDNCQSVIEEYKSKLVNGNERYKKIIIEYEKAEIDFKNIKNKNNENENIQDKIDDITREVSDFENKKGSLKRQSLDYKKLKKKIAGKKEELKSKKNDLVISDILIKMFGKNGISAKVINASIGEIEDYANNILKNIDDGEKTIMFKSSKIIGIGIVRDSLDIIISDKTDKQRKYETYSGGERTIINLSIRLALAHLLSRKNKIISSIIILDEVFGALDEFNKDKVVHVLNYLKKQFEQIFVISHTNIKDAFNFLLWVEKNSLTDISRMKKIA